MKLLIALLGLFLLSVLAQDPHIDSLLKLQKLLDLGIIDKTEFDSRKKSIVDSYIGVSNNLKSEASGIPAKIGKISLGGSGTYKYYRNKIDKNQRLEEDPTWNWTMPVIFTPQVDWLVSIFNNNMPKSYSDVLPYHGGKLYWYTHDYLSIGALDYNGSIVPFDDQVAIQERALTHVGLNLYDGGVWSVALAVSGLGGLVDMYQRNVLYTSATGANLQVGGLKSIRAWEPNPDPEHPPDPFYYGRDKIKNTEIKTVKMPGNMTYIQFKGECTCPSSGCCEQEGITEIPGNFFYRMIGPTYTMEDPFAGGYGYTWRAAPFGPNPDTAQYWNFAGIIHWNDWKPITGENVWGGILGPIQFLFIKNCTHIPKFSTWKEAPYEVQLALSILPAAEALQTPLGSMYHCPLGTKMYPPDDDEQTNVSNENNFSAWAAFKALFFILDNYYTGSDETLDEAKQICDKLIKGLENWFGTYLLPAKIAGQDVVSQGGHVTFDGRYKYQEGDQAFAVDCQTWGLLVLGAKFFDSHYKVSAYQIWQNTKLLAGYYIGNSLAGVGYTVPKMVNGTYPKPSIWSGEWTWGAVFMTRKLSAEYKKLGKLDWAASLLADSKSMVDFMTKEAEVNTDGVWSGGGLVQADGSYLYANKRFFIPWGWYANPIGATSSTAWAVLNDFEYDPFMLGGNFNTSFYQEQCKHNPPDTAILDKLVTYYNY